MEGLLRNLADVTYEKGESWNNSWKEIYLFIVDMRRKITCD